MKKTELSPNLRKLAIELFKIDQAPDVVETSEGLLAWNAPWIAELCFLARLNRPLIQDELTSISQTIENNFQDQFFNIFQNFNGLNFLNSIFCIYGFRQSSLDRADFYNFQNVPFDIYNLDIRERPQFAPEDVFLFATLGDAKEDFIDGFDLDGNIVTGKFSQSPKIISKWSNYEAWFRNRCAAAIEIFCERNKGVSHPFSSVH